MEKTLIMSFWEQYWVDYYMYVSVEPIFIVLRNDLMESTIDLYALDNELELVN